MSNGNGNVLRKVDNDSGYTKIDNNIFKNKDLSLKAKGLLSMMLSFADGWEFSVSGLTALSKDGIDSVRSGLNELEEFGYILREYPRDKGKFGKTIYHISQVPNLVGKTAKEKPHMANPHTDKPTREIQYNKELNNKELINKELTNTIDQTEELFNEFWEVYPRKIGKKKCASKYKKIDKETHLKIVNDIETRLMTKDWKLDKDSVRYIPHPETYLNNERWNDEIETNEVKRTIPVL